MNVQKRSKGIFIVIVILSLIGMIHFGNQKQGYHVDEMYSYGLANSEYLPFMHFGVSGYDVKDWMNEYGAGESFADLFRNLIKDYKILKEHDFQFYNTPIYANYLVAQSNSSDTRTTTWVSGQEYRDYLSASESNTFNYASVYYNQRGDVHPPLYYMLLHTISSVFQGVFSKWFGLVINIVFLMMTLGILYHMLEEYFGGAKVALAVSLVYGLSNGIFTTAMFLRMYAVLTFFVVSMCYVHLKICSEGFSFKKKNLVWLMLITLFGYMTHYYFVIYAGVTAIIFCVWMLLKRDWKGIFQYVLALGTTAVLGICVWPFSLKHVFSGYRGRESLGVITSGSFHWIKIKLVLDQVFGELFGGRWWLPCTALCLLIVAMVWTKKKELIGKEMLVFVPMFVYTVVVAQIVPFYVDRYFMCVFPFWCILLVYGIWRGVDELLISMMKTRVAGKEVLVCGGVILGVALFGTWINNGFIYAPGYLSVGGQETITVPENSHCVYVIPDGSWTESAEDTLMLSKCQQVAVVYRSNLEVLRDTYQHRDGEYVIVVVQRSLDTDAVVADVKDVLGTSDIEEVFREESYNTIRIYCK